MTKQYSTRITKNHFMHKDKPATMCRECRDERVTRY